MIISQLILAGTKPKLGDRVKAKGVLRHSDLGEYLGVQADWLEGLWTGKDGRVLKGKLFYSIQLSTLQVVEKATPKTTMRVQAYLASLKKNQLAKQQQQAEREQERRSIQRKLKTTLKKAGFVSKARTITDFIDMRLTRSEAELKVALLSLMETLKLQGYVISPQLLHGFPTVLISKEGMDLIWLVKHSTFINAKLYDSGKGTLWIIK